MTAGKYLMKDLQHTVTMKIETLVYYTHNRGVITDVPDFIAALRNIVTCASPNEDARKHMVMACIKTLTLLQKEEEFIALLRECGDLGADILQHDNLDRSLLGSWMCGKDCEQVSEPVCSDCEHPFFQEAAWNSRNRELWFCRGCEEFTVPVCASCEEEVVWIRRGIKELGV